MVAFDANRPDSSATALLGVREDAQSEVQEFVDPDANGIADNTGAIAYAIMRDESAKLASQELITLEQIIQDVLMGQKTPTVQFAPNGDIYHGQGGTMLPNDVLGAFVRGPNGQPGTILISDSLRHNPKKLAEVMLEEVGEAISDHAKHEGFEPAAGDVGNRIMQIVRGVPPEQVSFEVNDGGLSEGIELDPNTNYDEQYVLVNGVRRPAKTATEDAVDFGEMAEEWGVTEVEAAEAVSIAEENFERRDAEFLWADDPDVDNEAEWGRFVTIYGNGNKIGVYGMARAIIDGTMTLADNSVNEDAFAGLDLTQVSNHTLTDKIWTHAEESATAGVARSQISLTLLADAVAYVTGDAAGFTDNGTDWEAIQDTFADEIVEGETRQSGAEGPTRFSKDAIQSIWDSGAFAVTGYPDDGSITFEVDPTAAPAGSDVEDPAASVDPGLIGTGSTAFGVPEDATVSDITFMSAENNPTNRAVLFTTYTTASDPDNEYYVTLDATSGDYEVLSATVINGDADSVIVYDSEGSISEEFTISEWDPIANIVEGNNGEVIAEQIVAGIENEGHQVLTDQASPDASFAIYVDKDDGEHYIRYRFVNEDGTFAPPITALADSVEGSAVLDVHEQSSRIEEANFQNGQPSNHRLQVLESGVAIGAVIPEGATVFAAYEGAAAAALFPPVAIGVAIGVAAVVAYKYRHEIADGLRE